MPERFTEKKARERRFSATTSVLLRTCRTGGCDDGKRREGGRFLYYVWCGGLSRGASDGGVRALLFYDTGDVPGAMMTRHGMNGKTIFVLKASGPPTGTAAYRHRSRCSAGA